MAGEKLATGLTNLMKLVLQRGIPDEMFPIFYGGSLCALTKPNWGLRPIVAGNTRKRLSVKVTSETLVDKLGEEFRSVQKRPDGQHLCIYLQANQSGKFAIKAGAAANQAETNKRAKYKEIAQGFMF